MVHSGFLSGCYKKKIVIHCLAHAYSFCLQKTGMALKLPGKVLHKSMCNLTSLICLKMKLILKGKDLYKDGPRPVSWIKHSLIQMGPTRNMLRHVFFAHQENAGGKK